MRNRQGDKCLCRSVYDALKGGLTCIAKHR
nr:MAG TPA: hypothetical protein [Caudoviricetes sp.]